MNNKIEIPSTLSHMTLREYIDIINIVRNNDDNLINDLVVSYYLGLEVNDLKDISIETYQLIIDNINNCLLEASSPKRGELKEIIEIDGVKFGFIPSLKKDKMTTGEYSDLDKYCTDINKLSNTMAILYRPITKIKKIGIFRNKIYQYEIERYESSFKYNEKMLNIPASIAVDSLFFFSNLGKELLIHFQAYLAKLKKMMMKIKSVRRKETLVNISDGITKLNLLLEEISPNSIKSLK